MAQNRLTIGTRGSDLALWQANWVKSALEKLHSDLSVDLKIIKTRGDKILDVPLAKIGGKGLFIKELETALLEKQIDLAVHSMKDMPADLPQELALGPVPKRADPRDVLLSQTAVTIKTLKPGAVVGTSSLRRSAQLKSFRPDLEIRNLRGNLDTRWNKLQSEHYAAIVLAAAGVLRLGWKDRICEYIDTDVMLPAVAQGALCIELREDDERSANLLMPLNDDHTQRIVLAERAFLKKMEGSCQVPVAGHGRILGNEFEIEGLIAGLAGNPFIRGKKRGPVEKANEMATQLAASLLAKGGAEILAGLKTGE